MKLSSFAPRVSRVGFDGHARKQHVTPALASTFCHVSSPSPPRASNTELKTQMLSDAAPSSRQTIKFFTAATIAGSFLLLSGLTLTGTVIALVLATPVLVLFSPILVPAGITLLLTAAGFLFSGGCGVAAVSTLVWIYNYVKGKHPIGADQLDYARDKIVDKARDVKEKTMEYGQFVQQKAQAATQGTA